MKPAPTTAPFSLDNEVERLASLPVLEQRKAFFATLESMPAQSLARIQLGQVVPRALPKTCGGPWYEKEWNTLAGFQWPRREPSAVEMAETADHAEAVAIVGTLRAELGLAELAYQQAQRTSSNFDTHYESSPEIHAKAEAARLARVAAWEALQVARERYEEASQQEVRLRVHQTDRVKAAGRNWLRVIRRGAQ